MTVLLFHADRLWRQALQLVLCCTASVLVLLTLSLMLRSQAMDRRCVGACALLGVLVGCPGKASRHERWGESAPFDFPYGQDGGTVHDDTGTAVGAGFASGGTVGAWDRTYPGFTRVYCVRPPGRTYGTGDGSRWTHAFAGLPERLERGAKYYLASGEYPDHAFNDPVSGEQVIGLVKAVATDHGGDEGWDATMGQGSADFGPVQFVTGYFLVDGQTGIGGDGSSYGISISSHGCEEQRDTLVTFPWNTEATNISLRHVDIQQCGHRGDPTTGSEDAIYSYTAGVTRLAIKNCYVHDAFRVLLLLQNSSDILIEGTTFARAGMHHEAGSINLRSSSAVAIRRNVFIDSYGVFMTFQDCSGVEVSGNVVRGKLPDWEVWAAIWVTNGGSDISVTNNTFYNLAGLNVGIRDDSGASGLTVRNNLWARSRTNQIMLAGEHSHNAFFDNRREGSLLDERITEDHKQVLETDPFVDDAAWDLRLAIPTEAGIPLPPPRDLDLMGQTRGADGVWDRGAYEYKEP